MIHSEPLTLDSLELALAQLGSDKPILCVSPELEKEGFVLTNYLSAPNCNLPMFGGALISLKILQTWEGAQWTVQGE